MASFIFDFDGTIVDSLPLVTDLYYKWSGRQPFTKAELDKLRNSETGEILRHIDLPIWKIPQLLVKHKNEFGKRLSDVKVFNGIAETLKQLHNQGHTVYILSTNSTQNIKTLLKSNNLTQYVDFIEGNVGLFGKARALKMMIKRHKIDKSMCFYIGDETRDIVAAKKANVKSVAVSWGLNGPKILQAHKPDFFITKPADLLELLQ